MAVTAVGAKTDLNLLQRFSGAVRTGLRLPKPGRGITQPQATKALDELAEIGLLSCSAKSTQEEKESWLDYLWHSQDDLLEFLHKEWRQNLLYDGNEQFVAYHRDRKIWIPKRTLPWRVRSCYNVTHKAVNIRNGRLTENKPTVTVQAQTADLEDVEKAEYKESLFWYLWERLYLHFKIAKARRMATLCGGFLKAGWDPDAGCSYPATTKKVKYATVQVPVIDPAMTGQPAMQPQQVFAGLEEWYIDAKGNELGPVETAEKNELGEVTYAKAKIPEDTAFYNDGEAAVTVRSGFNVRWDLYAETLNESWYIQDGEILPLSKIAGLFPDKLEDLKEAREASDDDKALRMGGLIYRPNMSDLSGPLYSRQTKAESSERDYKDKEYFVVETWIFPKNPLVKKLWGAKGAVLTTVGGVLVEETELPEWALKACPFVHLPDELETGNHYGRSCLRDILPLQDDINRARSMRAEEIAMRSRLVLWAPANHGANVRALGNMNGVLVTTRTAQHKPEVLGMGTPSDATRQLEIDSIAAVADLGNMNDASTGKLPSAGIAAKAIYALQYADERSITEASTLQDIALKQLAEALDAVTRAEYKETRKIKLVGEDRAFMVEHEINPADLQTDVDYTFTPGSMMSRQKEAVKNEMFELMHEGLVDAATVKKHLSTAVPDIFRTSYSLQEAKARRTLQKILRASEPPVVQPAPFDEPTIFCAVIEEFALTSKWDLIGQQKQQQLMQLWQAYKIKQQQAEQAKAAAQAAAQPGPAALGAPGKAAPPPAQGGQQPPPGKEKEFTTPGAVQRLEQAAERGAAGAKGFERQATAARGQ